MKNAILRTIILTLCIAALPLALVCLVWLFSFGGFSMSDVLHSPGYMFCVCAGAFCGFVAGIFYDVAN
jgi:hypothetical protein